MAAVRGGLNGRAAVWVVVAALVCWSAPSRAFSVGLRLGRPFPGHAAPPPRHSRGARGISCQVGGLYADQEAVIVARGAMEEELMAGAVRGPLEAHVAKVKGVGASGGFGAKPKGSKGKADGKVLAAEGKSHAAVLKKEGVVRIDNVLSAGTADLVRDYAMALREDALREVEAGSIGQIYRFADVLLKTNRCDLLMPIGADAVHAALDEVICRSAIAPTIKTLLGDDAPLYELSCLISDPGSQRQTVHPDTPYGALGGLSADEPVLYTCFIALQDISLDMGPTVWLPGSNTAESHGRFGDHDGPKDELLRSTPSVLGTLPKGCCAIFDSRTLHCGTANRSEAGISRALFYVSFKNPKIGSPGNPGSIRPELINKLTLKGLRAALAELKTKGKSEVLEEMASSLH